MNQTVPPQPVARPPVPRTPTADVASPPSQLWAELPSDLAPLFRLRAADAAAAMLREIQRAIPQYARPLEGMFGKVITDGIEQAIHQFIDRLADPPPAEQPGRADLFRLLGRLEVMEGRSLDVLQSAYRIGARVAWRRVAEFGQQIGLPLPVMCTLAEAIFAYIDELAAWSVEGYTAAQARAAGAVQRRRKRLLELVLAEPAAAPAAIADLAAAAHWQVPERVAVVALERRDDQHELAAPVLDDDILVDLEGADPCLLISDPDRHPAALHRALRGWRAAIGPWVALPEAGRSLHWARRAVTLVARGSIPDAPVVSCADHLATLLLLGDEFLVRELADRALSPLRALTPRQRERMLETLVAWVETRGSAPEIATRLDVHPQTVRYRLRQLDDLFGDRLSDANSLFDLAIALRSLRLLEPESAA